MVHQPSDRALPAPVRSISRLGRTWFAPPNRLRLVSAKPCGTGPQLDVAGAESRPDTPGITQSDAQPRPRLRRRLRGGGCQVPAIERRHHRSALSQVTMFAIGYGATKAAVIAFGARLQASTFRSARSRSRRSTGNVRPVSQRLPRLNSRRMSRPGSPRDGRRSRLTSDRWLAGAVKPRSTDLAGVLVRSGSFG